MGLYKAHVPRVSANHFAVHKLRLRPTRTVSTEALSSSRYLFCLVSFSLATLLQKGYSSQQLSGLISMHVLPYGVCQQLVSRCSSWVRLFASHVLLDSLHSQLSVSCVHSMHASCTRQKIYVLVQHHRFYPVYCILALHSWLLTCQVAVIPLYCFPD